MSAVLQAALELVDAGVSVIPTLPGGQKKPAVAWKQHTIEAARRDQVEAWYTAHPEWGIAAISGAVSDNLVMVEVEGRAAHQLAALKAQAEDRGLGDLWQRVSAGWFEMSPSGGLHWFVRCTSPVEGNQKLANSTNKTVLAETRGERGYTIVAPTPGEHHTSGKPWVRLAGAPSSVATVSPEELDAFLALFRTLDETPAAPAEVAHQPAPTASPRPADGRRRPGDQWAEETTWAQILEPHGWQFHHRDNAGDYWTRPGKDRSEGISATTRPDGNLYVFSTSTDFQTEVPLSKLFVLAHYEHGGDMSAAAKALAAQGYGDQLSDAIIDLPRVDHQQTQRPTLHVIHGTDGSSALDIEPHPAPMVQVQHSGDLTEAANGKYLVDAYGDQIRYVVDTDRWLHWNGHTWEPTGRGAAPIKQLAITALQALPVRSNEEKRFRLKSLNSAGISNTLTLAGTDPRIAIGQDRLDSRHGELNTPGGIINLHTGQLMASDPSKLHTKSTLVTPDPNMPTPRWDQFLADTFEGQDPALIPYLQQLAGYSATGYVTAQVLPFLHGGGSNGKTVLATVLQQLLGDYAIPAPSNFLMVKQAQHPTELARLQGARLVVASEVPEGAKFDESKVKELTGGDPLAARYMHGDYFKFLPTHKLWLLGNHQPRVSAGGYSFWRRIRQIPFTNQVPAEKRVGNLPELLVDEEGPGILHWIIQGAVSYLSAPLDTPDVVLEATREYEASEDHLARFVEQRLHIGGGTMVRVGRKQMRDAYTAWCRDEGIDPVSAVVFNREVRARFDIGEAKSDGSRFHTNCTLLADGVQDEMDLPRSTYSDLGGGTQW